MVETVLCYGYEMVISSPSMRRDALRLSFFLPEPWSILCVETPIERIVFGIHLMDTIPIEDILDIRKELVEWMDHPFLEGFDFLRQPRFFSGVMVDSSPLPSDTSDTSDTSDDSSLSEVSDESDSSV